MSDELPIENIPAVMISYDHQISDGRILRFSTGIAQSAPPAEFDALLGKLTGAAERQEARLAAETLERQLETAEADYTQFAEKLVELEQTQETEYMRSNRKAPWGIDKLSAAQLKDREQAANSVKAQAVAVKKLRKNIDWVKSKANLDAPNSRANSH